MFSRLDDTNNHQHLCRRHHDILLFCLGALIIINNNNNNNNYNNNVSYFVLMVFHIVILVIPSGREKETKKEAPRPKKTKKSSCLIFTLILWTSIFRFMALYLPHYQNLHLPRQSLPVRFCFMHRVCTSVLSLFSCSSAFSGGRQISISYIQENRE